MKYEIRRTSQFKKDFDLIKKRNLDITEFTTVLNILVNGESLPEKYHDHPLRNSRECKCYHRNVEKFRNGNVGI